MINQGKRIGEIQEKYILIIRILIDYLHARRNRGLAQKSYALSLVCGHPDGSESVATHIDMYKFCELTLTIIINM